MIKINLLPRRVTRKKLTVIRHLVLGGLLVAALAAFLGFLWMSQMNNVKLLKSEISQLEQEKEKLKNVNQEKEQHEKDIDDLKRRIDVISQIEIGRTVPIHLLDEITGVLNDSMPVWLTEMSYADDKVMLSGFSFSNPDIARMVKELERTPYLMNVDLVESRKMILMEKEIFRFSMNALLEAPQGGK